MGLGGAGFLGGDGLWFGAQGGEEFIEWESIEDVFLFEPPAARGADAILHHGELIGGMRVSGDDNFDAAIAGHAEVDVFEVETIGISVALHGHAGGFGCVEDLFHVVFEGFAAKDEAAGGVRDNLGVGIGDGGENAVGHGSAFEILVAVNGDDYHIELGEYFVVEVETAIFEDIDFHAGEEADPGNVFLCGADFLDVFEGALFIETIGDRDRFGVIRNGDVFVAE